MFLIIFRCFLLLPRDFLIWCDVYDFSFLIFWIIHVSSQYVATKSEIEKMDFFNFESKCNLMPFSSRGQVQSAFIHSGLI